MRGETFGSEYKAVEYSLIKRLNLFLKPYLKYVVITVLLTLVTSALAPLRPFLTKVTIDDYIAKNDQHGMLIMIGAILLMLVVHGILQFFMTYIMQWVGQKVLLDIRIKLFEHIRKLSFKFYDKNPVGRLVTRVTNDVEGLNQMFSQGVIMIFADLLLILWIIGFMFYTNVQLSLLTLTVLPFLLLATSIFRRKVRGLFKDLRTEAAKMNSFLNEFFSGIATVKLFGQEKELNSVFDESNAKTKELNIGTVFYYAVFFPVVELLSTIAIGLVLWYSAGNIISGVMSIGTLIAFLQYSEMFFRPVRDLSEKYTTLQSAMASAEKIFELLDTEEFESEIGGDIEIDSFNNSIVFEDLSFSYDGNKTVLKNLNLEIKKGETVAIVGATGSGKTTIISLLLKFYKYTDGKILIDGKDINDLSTSSLRRLIGLVMQDVFLFSRNVEQNISLGAAEITRDEIENAIDELGLRDFINKLPDGLDTEVNERGTTLSAGQRQLISFARAFAAKPEILILDEATSNIDSETENLIGLALDKMLKDRTSIVIAHRLSTIKKADKIVVLHHGELREQGTHNELLAKNGLYAKLYQLQYKNLDS